MLNKMLCPSGHFPANDEDEVKYEWDTFSGEVTVGLSRTIYLIHYYC